MTCFLSDELLRTKNVALTPSMASFRTITWDLTRPPSLSQSCIPIATELREDVRSRALQMQQDLRTILTHASIYQNDSIDKILVIIKLRCLNFHNLMQWIRITDVSDLRHIINMLLDSSPPHQLRTSPNDAVSAVDWAISKYNAQCTNVTIATLPLRDTTRHGAPPTPMLVDPPRPSPSRFEEIASDATSTPLPGPSASASAPPSSPPQAPVTAILPSATTTPMTPTITIVTSTTLPTQTSSENPSACINDDSEISRKEGDSVMSCDEMNANLVGKEHTNWSTDLHVVQDWYDAYSLQCHLSSEESLWIHDMTNHSPTNWKNQTHYDSYS